MYTLFITIQYLAIVILLIEAMYIIRQRHSRLQVLLLVVVLATLVNCVGYLFELQADNKEQALLAVKFIYVGKPFAILGTFMFFMEYFKIRLSLVITYSLCLIHTSVTMLVLVCDKHRLFYNDIQFVQEGFFPHLVLGHGIVYKLYTACFLGYFLIMYLIGAYRRKRVKSKREQGQIVCLNMIICVSLAGLLIFFSGVTRGYDSTLPAHLVSALLLLFAMVKYGLLDTVTLAKEAVIDEFADGLVVLDSEERLIYSNPQVYRICPGLQNEKNPHFIERIEQASQSGEKLHLGNYVYQVSKRNIVRGDIEYGKMYVISDITENYHYMIRLEQQTEIANQANRAKSIFLAKMSHEIRTPINSVLGMNELILRESSEKQIRSYATDIKTSASALLSLINEILDSSKIESGKLEILPVEYELDSLLNDVAGMIFIKAKEKELDFRLSVDEALPNRLYGDDVRIRQILTNLLTNAVKYTEKGAVTLFLTGKIESGYVIMHYEVRDTGIGIKEEDMPKLCMDFERLEEKRNRSVEGTGLGMSIVVGLLRLMESQLKVDSVYGEGTTFSFDLRQKMVDEQPIGSFEERSRVLHKEQEYQPLFIAPEAKILLVDDNDINRRVFCNLLKATRVQITDVDSGEKCLDKTMSEHYDLIFLDHMMPGMDGVETLHYMREQEENLCKDTPVIILTANAVVGAKEHYLEEGFDDFLAKPINPEKLERMLRRWLLDSLVQENREQMFGDDSEDEETKIEVPEIEEFDLELARTHLAPESLLYSTLLDFYHSIDGESAQLEELAQHLEEPGGMEQYRVRVHALKSTAAMLGAMILSKLARLLERAASEDNRARIELLQPVLLEELVSHKEYLSVLDKQEKNMCSINAPQLLELLDGLSDCLYRRDIDQADAYSEQLGAFQFEAEVQQAVDRLREQIFNLDTEDALQSVQVLRKM